MSAEELRNVFHVDHHSSVPEYRLIQLNHHVSKRHVLAGHSSNVVSSFGGKSAHDKASKDDLKRANKFFAGPGKLQDTLTVDEELEDGVHRIRFEAFGEPVELKLRKTEGLFKKEGLKMWTVVSNETQPHGVEFVETEMVSLKINSLYNLIYKIEMKFVCVYKF